VNPDIESMNCLVHILGITCRTHWIWVCAGHRSCLDNGGETKSLPAMNRKLIVHALAWSLFHWAIPAYYCVCFCYFLHLPS